MPGKFVSRLHRGSPFKRSSALQPARAILEGLEDRRLFSTGYALFGNSGAVLAKFDTSKPDTIVSTKTVDGLPAGTKLVGIDFRPANGKLYALGISSTGGDDQGQIFTLDFKNTGDATAVGPVFTTVLAPGASYGFDFNPAADRIRIFNGEDQNLRVNPDTGALVQFDDDLDNASNDEEVTGGAYDRNVAILFGTAKTTLFGIDFQNDTLVRIGAVDGGSGMDSPNAGVVTEIGSLGIVTGSASNGFDIGQDGTAYAILNDADTGLTSLYTIDLTTGAATVVETINNGAEIVRGFTLAPDNFPPTANPDTYQATAGVTLVVSKSNGVLKNDTDAEGNPLTAQSTSGTINGLLLLAPDGSFTYQPDPGFVGSDTFFYNAHDGTSVSNAQVTINVRPTVSISDASLAEGNGGQSDMTFEVSLNAASPTAVVVNYKTQNVSGGEGDYVVIPSGSVTFAPGETIKPVMVKIKGDTKVENDETFNLKLTSVSSNAVLADFNGVGTILNDDMAPAGPPKVFISNAEVFEGQNGTKQLVFNVTLNAISASTVKVNFATQNFTAGEGDYGVKSGTLTFSAGQTLKQISITIKGDTKIESNEQFRINLSNLVNVQAGDLQALGTIKNDD